jgi:hypothetical protein
MASEIKANKISPATGTAFQFGDSGDTFTIPSGTTLDIASGATLDTTGATVSGLTTGKVLQVVQTVKTDIFSSTSTSYVDITGFSASITPTSATNKILVRFDITGGASSLAVYKLVRGSTDIAIGDFVTSHGQSTTQAAQFTGINGDRGYYVGMSFLDSPSTTSSTTYKVQGFTDTGTFYVNRSSSYSTTSVGSGSVSTITLIEIAG